MYIRWTSDEHLDHLAGIRFGFNFEETVLVHEARNWCAMKLEVCLPFKNDMGWVHWPTLGCVGNHLDHLAPPTGQYNYVCNIQGHHGFEG